MSNATTSLPQANRDRGNGNRAAIANTTPASTTIASAANQSHV
jgi:hypothetical protein